MMILFFAAENCPSCNQIIKDYLSIYKENDNNFCYIDINESDNEVLCDLLGINEAPILKVVKDLPEDEEKDIEVVFERKGYFDIKELKNFLENI